MCTLDHTHDSIPDAKLQRAADALRVLAHPQRLRMIEILLENPISVGDLAERVDLAPAAVSQHLNNMRAHDLVEARREGRQVYYHVTGPSAITIVDCIRANVDRI
jgi:DNA-binding transcriptional ArsR family regulator